MPTNAFLSPRLQWTMLLAFLVPATLLMAVDRVVVTIAAPMLQVRFGLTLPELGLVFSVFFWAYAAMQVPAGILVDRFGPRLSMLAAMIVWSAATLVTPFTGGLTALLFVRALLGIGQAPDWPASIVAARNLFDAEKRPVANSILLCALYGGPVVGAPLAGWMLGAAGLEAVFILFGAVGLLFAITWWIFYRDLSVAKVAASATFTSVIERCYWFIIPAYTCAGFVLAFYMIWFPTYLMKARGLTLDAMGIYLGVNSAALCLSVLLAGRVVPMLSRGRSNVRRVRIMVASIALAVTAFSSLIVPIFASDFAALCASCLAVTGIGFAQVATWSTVQDVGGIDTARLSGFVSFGGNFAAGASPIVSAALVEWTGGWQSTYVVLAAAALSGALFWAWVGSGATSAAFAAETGGCAEPDG